MLSFSAHPPVNYNQSTPLTELMCLISTLSLNRTELPVGANGNGRPPECYGGKSGLKREQVVDGDSVRGTNACVLFNLTFIRKKMQILEKLKIKL